MKTSCKLGLFFVFAFGGLFRLSAKETPLYFTENKGQVSDQFNKPRPDVLFGGSAKGMTYHLRRNGISYQLLKVNSYREEDLSRFSVPGDTKRLVKMPDQTTIYRLDINWIGANPKPLIQTDGALEGYSNYYLEVCPNGATRVRTFTGVWYKDLYKGIDLHYYEKDGELKYDYIVRAGADYKKIQLQMEGASAIKCNKDGSLTLCTPLGHILEGAPIIFQDGKQLSAKWKVQNKILSFDIKDYDPAKPLLIDPVVRVWGTYYGDAANETGFGSCADAAGNVYMSGQCNLPGTAIATSGGHQVTYGGWYNDAFLVKFNPNGVRLWGTYYGGTLNDYGYGCAMGSAGMVYMGGRTESIGSMVIATPGSHQQAFGGGNNDGFLVQFDGNGIRQWGTYYGGNGIEFTRCVTDAAGDPYLCGETSSLAGISTNGSHQANYGGGPSDAFLVKFNSSGVRQWGTYYGGPAYDIAVDCTIDAAGNVLMVGITQSTLGTTIATPGSLQPAYMGGSNDGYLVKFTANGVRQWGTYYGGSGRDYAQGCATDAAGNIFIVGDTQSPTGSGIATPGSFQYNYGGGIGPVSDAYFGMLSPGGVRRWGTYCGTTQDEKCYSVIVNNFGHIYFSGETTSPYYFLAGSTAQNGHGGAIDAFLSRFDSLGVRVWSTNYGGYAAEQCQSCCVDANHNIYLVGGTQTSSTSGTVIASPGAHQNIFGGNIDAYIVKFNDCDAPGAPTNITPISSLTLCPNESASLLVNAPDVISWFATSTSTTVLGSGNSFTVQGLSVPGTYTYYAAATSTCLASGPRTSISLTVLPVPLLSVSGPSVICSGQSATLAASGGNNYSWSSGVYTATSIVTPSISTSYSVMGYMAPNLCVGSAIFNLAVNPSPSIVVTGPAFICTQQNAVLVAYGANTYTWNSGLTTATNVVAPAVNTTYTVTGTLSGCIASEVFNITVSTCAGIGEMETEMDVKIFPNPNSGALSLVLPSSLTHVIQLHCKIINSLGQVMISSEIRNPGQENSTIEIDTSLLPAGVYYLQLEGVDKVYKLVKE